MQPDDVVNCPFDGMELHETSQVMDKLQGGTVAREKTGDSKAISSDTYSNVQSAPPLASGTLLGSYRLIRMIAEGGMGQVYEAEHVHLDRRVALKLMHPEVAERTKAVKRFFSEARAVNRIHHENIVEITDIVDSGQREKFYIMELLDGEPLSHRLKRTGYIPVPLALDIGVQLASALSAVHDAGIVHRDLKPPNIFLVGESSVPRVKLLDFGVAKLLEAGRHRDVSKTSAGAILGTPSFMAPEQFNSEPVDARTDVYAFGILLYLMVTGEMVFYGKNLGELTIQHLTVKPRQPGKLPNVPQNIPAELDRLILNCLKKEPEKRPQTMDEVRRGLLAVDPQQPSATLEFELPTPLESEKSKTALWAGGGVLALVLAVVAALALGGTTSDSGDKKSGANIATNTAGGVAVTDVMIVSDPPGAEVLRLPSLKVIGKTPLTLRRPPSGQTIEMRLRLEGHVPKDLEISSEGESVIQKKLAMLPPGQVAQIPTPTPLKKADSVKNANASKKPGSGKTTGKKTGTAATKKASDKKRTRGVILNPFSK
jgi:serine/threonine-protein kinase